MTKKVSLFTDGACSGNPGPGGWGVLMRFDAHTKELYGGERHTTNNRMEIMAAIQGLLALKEPCEVMITTDSQYLRLGITTWIIQWKRAGWRTSRKQPVKNVDLWQQLDEAVSAHSQVNWHWVKAHNGHADNERADWLARQGIVVALSHQDQENNE